MCVTKAKEDFPADSSPQAWIRNPSAFLPMTRMSGYRDGIREEVEGDSPRIAYVREPGEKNIA